MSRFFFLLATALLLTATAAADNALEDLRGLRTRLSKVPLYNGRHLQLMVFSPESEQRGGLLVAKDPVMDIIRRSADINTITTGPETKLYPLGTELPELFRFWSQRLFSDGVASADHADIDQSTGHIVGDGEIHFRAPMLDLDGVGFDGDYLNRTLAVKQQVVALLRAETSNPLRYLNGKTPLPDHASAIRVTGDTLFIDFEKGEITLSGTIRITDKRMTGSCDRMLILLAQGDDGRGGDDDDEAASVFSVDGVREIVLTGHVRMEAVPENPEAERRFATAEKVVLRPGDGTIQLTGEDRVFPVLRQGENSLTGQEIRYSRQTEKLEVLRQARMVYLREEKPGERKLSRVAADRILYDNNAGRGELVGHVTVDDSDMYLQCGRGRFRLNRNAAAKESGGETGGAEALAGIPRFSGGGELEEVVCTEKVRMSRKEGDRIAETVTAEQATLDWRGRVLTLKGGVPTISRGADTLSAGRLTLHLDEEKLLAEPASKVVLCAGDSADSQRTVITSDTSNFDYGGNLLVFEGNVQVRDPRLDVDCKRMEIVLKPDPKAASSAEPAKSAGFGSGGGKVLDRIVCIGSVHAREPRMDLTGDKVTLTFAEAKDPENAPTAFKSGSIALDRIDCEGHVRLEHIPEAEEAAPKTESAGGTALWQGGSLHRAVVTSDTATMTLPDNRAVFDGNVRVRETSTALDCRKLELFGRAAKPAVAPTEAEQLDADPFAKVDVSRAPKAVAIGDNRELERVIASGDVDFTRKVETGTQRVTGDRAEYVVDKRELTITGKDDKRPRFYDADASRNGVADRIVVDLATEKVHMNYSTIEFDPQKFN